MSSALRQQALLSPASELADHRMAKQLEAYQVNPVRMQPVVQGGSYPFFSYGIQADRLAEAPPSSIVDVETRLNNRYDIIGKSGYVYRTDADVTPQLRSPSSFEPPTSTPIPPDFFAQAAGRDFECDVKSFYRADIVIPTAPYIAQQQYVDTRAATKDQLASCKQ